jgi:hypothetical protein
MTVWTIAAQAGTGGDRIAAGLAASAGVPLLDRQTLAQFAHDLNPDELEVEDIEQIEERFGGRLRMLALSTAMTTAALAAVLSRRSSSAAGCPTWDVPSSRRLPDSRA